MQIDEVDILSTTHVPVYLRVYAYGSNATLRYTQVGKKYRRIGSLLGSEQEKEKGEKKVICIRMTTTT